MGRAVPDGRLTIPPLPPRHLARPRLLTALDDAVSHPLTLVAAGPGWGKSVLLSAWARGRSPRPAWVSLDPDDDDPSRFWPALVGALRIAGRRAGPVPAADAHTQRALGPFLDAAHAAGRTPIVLVLDDAHVLTDREILRGLDECVREWGERLRVIVAARSDPLLALHRHRRAGALAEVRMADLAMSDEEAANVLAEHGVELPQRELRLLLARTEGWAAGIRLSAMRMEGAEHPAEFVTEFALDHGSAGEYLIHEVLDRQPRDVRRLLVETSFLAEVTGPLAHAVTDVADAERMLAELTRTNSFVVPLDRSAESYRYHQLMQQMLRYLLRREPVEHRRLLLRRAAHWYAGAGDLVQALHCAAEAEDSPFAVRALVNGGLAGALIQRLDSAALHAEWLTQRIADDDEPESIVAGAALCAHAGRPERARAHLDRLPRRPAPGALADTVALVELLLARAAHDVPAADALAARLGRDRELTPAVRLEQAMTRFYAGEHETVDALLRSAATGAHRAGQAVLELECLAQLAHVNAFWGGVTRAHKYERRAEELIRTHSTLAAPASLVVAAAERGLAHAEVSTAVDAARRAATMPVDARDADLRAEIAILQGVIWSSTGHFVDARRSSNGSTVQTSGLVAECQLAFVAAIESALGRPNTAIRVLETQTGTGRSGISALAAAHAHGMRGDLDRAEAALRPLLDGSVQRTNRLVLVEAHAFAAHFALARQDEARAAAALWRAVDLAGDEVLLPFVRANRRFAQLRDRHPSLRAAWPVAEDARFDDHRADVDDIGTPVLEPLTDRERAVLRWLATTMSTNEIADELCLSVNTVKTHIAALYRKLAAAQRRDAVQRAHELELL
jgi:LuxR family maltose regulon positive regulatory protein